MIIKNIQLNPELAELSLGMVKLNVTNHAKSQRIKRNMPSVNCIDVKKGSIVEMEIDENTGKATKLVVRVSYTRHQDQVHVICPTGLKGVATLVTSWLNSVTDNHSTLKLANKLK